MAKKFSLLIATAVALVALAVPATVNAGTIEDESGELLSPGAVLVGSSAGVSLTKLLGGTHAIQCGPGSLPFELKLTENSGSYFKLAGLEAIEPAGCSNTYLKKFRVPYLESSASGSGTIQLEFALGNVWFCNYKATLPISYLAGSDEFSFSGALVVTPAACGSGSISGALVLAQKTEEGPSPIFLN